MDSPLAIPFAFEQLDHVVLRTEHIETLRDFYMLLGCQIVEDRTSTIGLLQLSLGNSMLDLVDVNGELGRAGGSGPGPVGRNLDHFAVRVAPFDAKEITEFCKQNGIKSTQASQLLLGADGYGPAIFIEDPDGNRIELKGPTEQA